MHFLSCRICENIPKLRTVIFSMPLRTQWGLEQMNGFICNFRFEAKFVSTLELTQSGGGDHEVT